jgi:hypothetical protein
MKKHCDEWGNISYKSRSFIVHRSLVIVLKPNYDCLFVKMLKIVKQAAMLY